MFMRKAGVKAIPSVVSRKDRQSRGVRRLGGLGGFGKAGLSMLTFDLLLHALLSLRFWDLGLGAAFVFDGFFRLTHIALVMGFFDPAAST